MKKILFAILILATAGLFNACDHFPSDMLGPYVLGTERKEGRIDNFSNYNTQVRFDPIRDNRIGEKMTGAGEVIDINAQDFRHYGLSEGITYAAFVYNPTNGGWQKLAEISVPDTDNPTQRSKRNPDDGPFFWVLSVKF